MVNKSNVFQWLIFVPGLSDAILDKDLIHTVQLLIEDCDVDPFLPEHGGSTILTILANGGEILPFLTSVIFPLVKPPDSHFNKFDSYGMTLLHILLYSPENWDEECLAYFLLAGADVTLASPASP